MKAHDKETFLKINNKIFAECQHGGTRQSFSFSKKIENFAECLPILALGAECPIESSRQRAALPSETLLCALCHGWPSAKCLLSVYGDLPSA
jgi:hypothetical protein